MAATALWTSLAMVAFAANSIFCRLALGDAAIDAASFTTVRLASGAAMLLVLSRTRLPNAAAVRPPAGGTWGSAALLFLYAIAFSLAYISLTAGAGALLLFGAVQVTMIAAALRAGERPAPAVWAGLAGALGGLVYLVLPGLSAPPVDGAALMMTAGIAWGLYSLRGRRAGHPLADTAGNFLRTIPMTLAVTVPAFGALHASPRGVLFAALSGALASAVGYVVWYTALRGLSSTRAATVQLSVPLLAAAGGVIFLAEAITPRLVVSAALILGGVALAVTARERKGLVKPQRAGR